MVVEPLMDDDNRNVSESVAAAAAKTNHCPLKFETLTGSELLPAFQFFPNVNAKKDPIANAGSCVCSTLRSLNVDIIQLGFEFVGDDIVGSYFPIVSVASLWFFLLPCWTWWCFCLETECSAWHFNSSAAIFWKRKVALHRAGGRTLKSW